MEELLILIFQPLLEIFAQILASGLIDLLGWGRDVESRHDSSGCAVGLLLFILGCGLGWLSLLLIPHTLLPWAWLRIANLIVGPLVSGWISWRISVLRKRTNKWVSPSRHAWFAALACFGIVLVRFSFGQH